jgi:hypothetical protein
MSQSYAHGFTMGLMLGGVIINAMWLIGSTCP